jgi:type III pantothenate kinase
MLLLIDAGNTRLKWACVQLEMTSRLTKESVTSVAHGSLSHADIVKLTSAISPYAIKQILISNVAGSHIQESLSSLLLEALPIATVTWFHSQAYCAGLNNTYENPQQLGSDRFASAIAAHYLFPDQAVLVATCGTATTVDAVSRAGEFKGGMILPGLQIMAQSLAKNTAQLPQVSERQLVPALFATNTSQAIVSGCIHAQTGAISCAVDALKKLSKEPVRLIVSGGAAPYLLPYVVTPADVCVEHIENLVLTGLWVVAKSHISNT